MLKQESGQDKQPPLARYFMGMSGSMACDFEQRLSYRTYVPSGFAFDKAADFKLLVLIHSTIRDDCEMLDDFKAFADEENLVLLAPLFPGGLEGHHDLHSYKYFQSAIRYDLALLDMIDCTATRLRLSVGKFALYGFSGGAHFAHRFFYLHPERLAALSIAAPGSITRIDNTKDWWVGTRNFPELFGRPLDMDALKSVPIHLVVGADDTEKDSITHSPDGEFWMDGANDAGSTRVDRLRTYHESLKGLGFDVAFESLPNVGHEGSALAAHSRIFLRSTRFLEE